MMETLVHALHIPWGQPCRDRLDALALAGEQKTRAVRSQRDNSIRVPCGPRQALEIKAQGVVVSRLAPKKRRS
jgi:hypothetical protein